MPRIDSTELAAPPVPRRTTTGLLMLTHVSLHLRGDKKRWVLLANKTPRQMRMFSDLRVGPLTDARLLMLVS